MIHLAAQNYTVWKYEVTDEENQQSTFPIVTAQLLPVLPVVVRDLQSPAELLLVRTALGDTQAQGAYAALQAEVEDPRQDLICNSSA